jgi:AGCS family alanine or glycine:cation symporter
MIKDKNSFITEVHMLEFINDNVISVITPILLIVTGLFFSFKLNFFHFRHPIKIIRSMLTREKKGGISPFRAVTLALAGTLGVGNIAGVASSIAIGGFGSVFWMWISAIVAMVLKYAEITLAIAHRRTDFATGEHHGGASYYIYDYCAKKNKKILGKLLGAAFALLCIINAVTMGCVIQSNAISSSFEGVMNIPAWAVGGIVSALSLLVIFGNAKWISSFSEKSVPIMTIGYILLSVAVLAARSHLVGDAFAVIFKDAFNLKSATGGAVGFGISRALKAGTMRGLMSNEAGCGTAPTAHAAATTDSPAKQGFWGIFEVFVDTILLCTLTALAIIVSMLEGSSQNILSYAENPMMMTIKAYSSVLGSWSEYFMAISVLLFAFATIICWAHYGKESIFFLTPKRFPIILYLIIYCIFIFIGSLTAPKAAWLGADLALGTMTAINLAVLILMSDEVKHQTNLFFDKNNGRKP